MCLVPNGVLLHDLQLWRQTAAQSLADPQDQRASHSPTTKDRHSINEHERDLRRNEKESPRVSRRLWGLSQAHQALNRTAANNHAFGASCLHTLSAP